MMLALIILLVSAAIAIFVAGVRFRRSFPPGPHRLPIIGNAHQLPANREWLRYAAWGKLYGPILYLELFSQSVIVLNSNDVAVDLLEKRSGIYSDRPILRMAGELVGWNRGVTLSSSNDRHKRFRKLLHGTLGAGAVSANVHPVLRTASRKLLRRLLHAPESFMSHIRDSVGESIMKVAFGQKNLENVGDDFIALAEDAQEKFSRAATPYAYMVDFLPILKYVPSWFPGAQYVREARAWRAELEYLVYRPVQIIKERRKSNTAWPSFVSNLLEAENLTAEDEDVITWSAASLFTGGADTTVSAIGTFFLAMCLHPVAQKRAQVELDELLGEGRLPTFEDRPKLPYLNACVKEVFRWQPVTPMGVAHRVTKEDEYNGYRIPKGTTVITNIWAMMHDEKEYPNPDIFFPERFLGESKDKLLGFGFGRRKCPGRWMADSSLFITMASVLSAFEIKPLCDESGSQILPEVRYTTGLISHPIPFKCSIAPRSKLAEFLINESV